MMEVELGGGRGAAYMDSLSASISSPSCKCLEVGQAWTEISMGSAMFSLYLFVFSGAWRMRRTKIQNIKCLTNGLSYFRETKPFVLSQYHVIQSGTRKA